MSFLINPYAFLAAGGDFESIATVTVGSGGAATASFTSIPTDYQHLQIRHSGRLNGSDAYGYAKVQLNSTDFSYIHTLGGGGSSAYAQAYSSSLAWIGTWITGTKYLSSLAAAGILDILDYQSSKAKVVRIFDGYDANTSSVHGGYVTQKSMLFSSVTSAVTSITLTAFGSGGASSTFAQHTTFALYGIKGAA